MTPGVAAAIRRGEARGAPGGLIGEAADGRRLAPRAGGRGRGAPCGGSSTSTPWPGCGPPAPPPAPGRSPSAPPTPTFNGFNFSVQAVLGQNRDQFLAGLASAADRTTGVPTGVLLLLLGALGAMFWGFQLRINDYR